MCLKIAQQQNVAIAVTLATKMLIASDADTVVIRATGQTNLTDADGWPRFQPKFLDSKSSVGIIIIISSRVGIAVHYLVGHLCNCGMRPAARWKESPSCVGW